MYGVDAHVNIGHLVDMTMTVAEERGKKNKDKGTHADCMEHTYFLFGTSFPEYITSESLYYSTVAHFECCLL